jgi:hypothetical protein
LGILTSSFPVFLDHAGYLGRGDFSVDFFTDLDHGGKAAAAQAADSVQAEEKIFGRLAGL